MVSPCYCAALRKAARRLSASYDEALEPLGINIAQFALLRTVARNENISLSELGRAAGLDRSTIGRNVRVLERRQLMRTSRGNDDKREAVIALTVKGHDLLAAAVPAWEQCQQAVEGRFGEEGIAMLRMMLHAIESGESLPHIRMTA